MPRRCTFKIELDFPQPLAGVDEAGCAPLAGPVVAAACILDRNKFPRGIDNSKNLPLEKREALYARITKVAAFGVGMASVEEIDSINIYWARMLAMTRAVEALGEEPGLGAGRRQCLPEVAAAVQGDRRRRRQVPLDRSRLDHRQGHSRSHDGRSMPMTYPGYGWERNRGYPTPDHRRALRELGPTPLHRRSFGLVREMMAAAAQPELALPEIATASPLSHTTTG